MDKVTRKELKADHFVEEVGHTVEYVKSHQSQLARYGGIAGGVIALIVVLWVYLNYQSGVRSEALRAALRVQDAAVGQGNPSQISYPTQAEKDAAVKKSFEELYTKYPSKNEGLIARYYLGVFASDQGKTADAEKAWKEVAEGGDANYASQAKLSLAQLYASQNKMAESESLLKSIIDKPTVLVSKEQAIITLARIKAVTDPAAARKLLEPLRAERSAVSRAAISALGEIPIK